MHRILVIATRQIGDVLLTTPLIAAAHERWPEAQIDVLGFRGTMGMLRGNAHVHECIEVAEGSGWLQSMPLLRRLWRRYDLALVAQATDRAHLYGWAAARRRTGLVTRRQSHSWWKLSLLEHAVVMDANKHAALEKLELLKPWCDAPPCVDVVPPRAHKLPFEQSESLRREYVILHVPSLVRYKQWPLRHQETLVRGLLQDGYQVVLSGGPSEADRRQTAELAKIGATPQLIDLGGRLDLNEMTTLLSGSALYIGPDTSITHQAAACGVPVLAIFGPVSPLTWGPWPQGHQAEQPWMARSRRQRQRHVVILQGSPPCVPCGREGCENHKESRSDCLESLDGESVLAEARALLRGRGGGNATAPSQQKDSGP